MAKIYSASIFTAFILFATSAFGFWGSSEEAPVGVLTLGDETLRAATEEHEYLLVKFYAPWCGHCKSLEPVYDEVAQLLAAKSDDSTSVRLAKVDATVETKSAEEYGVRGYPTLKFFINGEVSDYDGPREAKGMLKWIEKRTGDAYVVVESVDEMEKVLKENSLVLALFNAQSTPKDIDAFNKLATENDDAVFVVSNNEAVLENYAIDSASSKVVAFKQYDEGRVDFTEKINKAKLKKFLIANLLPKVVSFDDTWAPKLFGGDFQDQVFMFGDVTAEENKSTLEAYATVAKDDQFKSLTFVTVDTTIEENNRIADFFGLTGKTELSIRGVNLAGRPKKYGFESDNIDEGTLRQFAKSYLDGALTQEFASEPIPDGWDAEPVKVVVGKNFEEVSMDATKHVFMKFYAPWCGHCKSLAPVWDELGAAFEDNDDVVIAKMDFTVNEADVDVQGFPTLMLFPKGEGSAPVIYNGGRSLEELTAFVKEHTDEVEPEKDQEVKTDEAETDEL